MGSTLFIIIYILFIILFTIHTKANLQMFQQNSYRNERYSKWLKKSYLSSPKFAFDILLLGGIAFLFFIKKTEIGLALLAFLLFKSIAFSTKKGAKVPLTVTNRVKRLFVTSLLVFGLLLLVAFLLLSDRFSLSTPAILLLLSPLVLMIANILLKPVEIFINHKYINDAKRILGLTNDLKIIGITGSYGKTSTKHFLQRILAEKYNTLMTPGSYNTTLGVVRTIRDYLKPTHEVFVVEMGAKQLGDIKEIAELVSPTVGIITAVGEQHLDTFKTIENVKKTKFELIDSLPKNGLAVLNYDYELIRTSDKNKDLNNVFYSTDKHKNCWYADHISYNSEGMFFDVFDDKGAFFLNAKTKLLGNYNISNILSAIIVAHHLDMNPKAIARGIRRLEPVKHRLEIIKRDNGITIIDDAFNSNPMGAEMALKVLAQIEGNTKIVVTPGMIELGNKQFELNKKFGQQIAEHCDKVVLVGKKQTQAIHDGLMEANFSSKDIFIANSLNEASKYVNSTAKSGDVILYENDLPDMFK